MKRIVWMMKAALFGGMFGLLQDVTASPSGGGGSAANSGAHWGYEGKEGPANWGRLGYPMCAKGKNQSPVDLSLNKTASLSLDKIAFDYSPSNLNVINNGHTVQFNIDPGSTITVGGETYKLLQFHFHSPSENTIKGQALPLEVHLVHKSDAGHLAVVGVLFKTGKDNAEGHGHGTGHDSTLPHIMGSFNGVAGMNLNGNVKINPKDLLPHDDTYWHFMGSLTTPPCSENVRWFVMQQPMEITPGQLTQFQSIYDNYARPVQPWNRRVPMALIGGSGGGGH